MTNQPTNTGQGAQPPHIDPQQPPDGPQQPPQRPPIEFETVFKDHVPQNLEYRDKPR
jgi:hypothetical protein